MATKKIDRATEPQAQAPSAVQLCPYHKIPCKRENTTGFALLIRWRCPEPDCTFLVQVTAPRFQPDSQDSVSVAKPTDQVDAALEDTSPPAENETKRPRGRPKKPPSP